MKRILLTILFAAVLLGPKVLFANVIFYDDAEDEPKESYDWKIINPYQKSSITVSSEKARSGGKSYKYAFIPDVSLDKGIHIELRLLGAEVVPQVTNFLYGRDYWVGYSVFVPDNFIFPESTRGEWVILGQFHGVNDACETAKPGPLMAFFLDGSIGAFAPRIRATDDFCFDGAVTRHKEYTSPPIKKGAWNDIVMNFRFNYVDSGNPFFKVWMNGQLVVDDKGPNCYNDAKPPYLKLGIYSNAPKTMTVFYDEIRVGDEKSSYQEVTPSGSKTGEMNIGIDPPQLRLIPTN